MLGEVRLAALEDLASSNEGDRSQRIRGYIQCLDYLRGDEFASFAESATADPAPEEHLPLDELMELDSEGAFSPQESD